MVSTNTLRAEVVGSDGIKLEFICPVNEMAIFSKEPRDDAMLIINGALTNRLPSVPHLLIDGLPISGENGALSVLTAETAVYAMPLVAIFKIG